MFVQWTNQFWLVLLGFILFLEFLKLFVKMHLAISFARVKKNFFLDLWIKNYVCLKFLREVWAGRACARTNAEELTTCKKIWGQEGGGRRQGGAILGELAEVRSATNGCQPPAAP